MQRKNLLNQGSARVNLLYLHSTRVDTKMANMVQVMNMCQAFAQNGAAVTLAIAEPSNTSFDVNRVAEAILDEKPEFSILTYRKYTPLGRFEILGCYAGVTSLLRKTQRPDLCFVRDPFMLTLSLDAGLPTLFESHNSVLQTRNNLLNQFWKSKLLKDANKPLLIKFITISKALMNFWKEHGVPEEKLLVLHDGFNHHIFSSPVEQSEARAILGLPNDRKIVVYSGSLQPDRGIERIIELAKRFPTTLFIALGGPDNFKSFYENQTLEAGLINILWPGYVSQRVVAQYLSSADVLLMLRTWNDPTINFNSPLKLFEYMATGKIIVGEAFPTVTEILGKETAYLAQPESLDDLCEKVHLALMENYPCEMAINVRRLAVQEYSWNIRARKILNCIN